MLIAMFLLLELGREVDYYWDRSSMSGYGFGNWFTKIFSSALYTAKKYIEPVAADFELFTLHNWGSGKDSGESFPQNIRSGKRFLGEQRKS